MMPIAILSRKRASAWCRLLFLAENELRHDADCHFWRKTYFGIKKTPVDLTGVEIKLSKDYF
jgi:hypothetical protein